MKKLCRQLIKLYREFFYVPKHGKVRDKVMLSRIAVSVVLIVGCMAAMSITAYAYFSCSVTSGANIIRSATYKLDITPPVGMENVDIYILDNSNGGEPQEFKFTLTLPADENIASVGYCKIVINENEPDEKEFYTQPIGKANETSEALNERTVTIEVPATKKVTVKFIAQWGSCTITRIEDRISLDKTNPSDNAGQTFDLTTDTATATQNSSSSSKEQLSEEGVLSISDQPETSDTGTKTDTTVDPTDTTDVTESTEKSNKIDNVDTSDSKTSKSSETDAVVSTKIVTTDVTDETDSAEE